MSAPAMLVIPSGQADFVSALDTARLMIQQSLANSLRPEGRPG